MEVYNGRLGFYGTDFYVLLTPLFYLVQEPIIIRQVALGLVVFIVLLQAVISFKIMIEFLNVTDKKFAFLLSIGLSFLPVIRSNMAINEPPLEFFMWLVLYLTLININSTNKTIIVRNTIVIALVLCYTRTIHGRALTFIVAFSITIVLCMVLFKKKIVALFSFGIVMGLGYLISELYI